MASWYAQAAGNWSAIAFNTQANGGGTPGTAASIATGDFVFVNNYSVNLDIDPNCLVIYTTGGTLTITASFTVAHNLGISGSGSLVTTAGITTTLAGSTQGIGCLPSGTGTFALGTNAYNYLTFTGTTPTNFTQSAGSARWILGNGSNGVVFAGTITITSGNFTLDVAGATFNISGTLNCTGGYVYWAENNVTLTVTSTGSMTVTTPGGLLNNDPRTGAALTVGSGGTLVLNCQALLGASSSVITLTQAAGANVTLMGQRVYVSGDSTDPGVAYVLAPAAGGPASYKINQTSLTGTVTEAATTDVRHGTQYGAGGTAYTGSAYIPAANTVLVGTNVDATTGTVTEAATTDVRHGTQYGAGGTAHTGSAYIPSAANVLSSIQVDATTGTLVLPATTVVLTGVQYGVGGNGSTGTLVVFLATIDVAAIG